MAYLIGPLHAERSEIELSVVRDGEPVPKVVI